MAAMSQDLGDSGSSRSEAEEAATMECLRDHQAEMGLSEARSCVSVGPGTGQKDCGLLRHCLPSLRRYYGLEPDRRHLQLLQQALQRERARRRGGLEVRLKLQRAETWAGPSEPVDLVLLFHVLQFVREHDRPALLRRCRQWLAPGGTLLLLVQRGTAEWEEMLATHCDVPPRQLGLEQQARHCLQMAGLAPAKEHQFAYSLDVSSPSDAIVTYFLHRPASQQDIYHFEKRVREVYPSGEVPFHNVLFVCRNE